MNTSTKHCAYSSRRQFIKFLSASPFFAATLGADRILGQETADPLSMAKNVFEIEKLSSDKLTDIALRYCNGGADDLKTVKRNSAAFDEIQIRARRLIDVSKIDTSVTFFGRKFTSPIMLSPVGFQQVFHEQGELAMARAADRLGHQIVVSTVSSYSIKEIAKNYAAPIWFQLYPTPDRVITNGVINMAREARCSIMVLTVDTPVIGNRENHAGYLTSKIASGELVAGNLVEMGAKISALPDPTLDWDFVKWLKSIWRGPVVLKGIVTHEDAALCLQTGVDGIIISNHGGRQLESNRSTIECLPEIIDVAKNKIPVLIDGGIRRGTDIFKSIALGASAVCIGRPYLWGLAAAGQAGVERVLELLQAELILDMKLAGATSIRAITKSFVQTKW